MNAADVCLVGSHREGWSLAMCEMIACGKAVVSTDVSGARDMVQNGKNGYVVSKRDSKLYADTVMQVMQRGSAKQHSLENSRKYAVSSLAKDLGELWKPLEVEYNEQ